MLSVASTGLIEGGAEYPSEVTPPPGVEGVHPVRKIERPRVTERRVTKASGEVLMGKV